MAAVTVDRTIGTYYTKEELGRDDYFSTYKPTPIQKIVWISHDDGKTATLVGLYDLEKMIGYTFDVHTDNDTIPRLEKHATIRNFCKNSTIYEIDEFKPCVYGKMAYEILEVN